MWKSNFRRPTTLSRELHAADWLILTQVQTRCPLHKQGCAWTGDLGSLQGHLTNSDSHLQKGMSQGDVYDALKKEGDERYRARAYDQAAELYSKAAWS